jgi:hypothetical protein
MNAQTVLRRCGEVIAGLWLSILGLVVLLAFPAAGIVLSLVLGGVAAELVGGGTFGVVLLAIVALAFGVFLSVYMWEPVVKGATYEVVKVITDMRPT